MLKGGEFFTKQPEKQKHPEVMLHNKDLILKEELF